MNTHIPLGTRVYTAPKADAPIIEAATVDKPAKFGPVPPRPEGVIAGVQDLEPPLSYLVKKDDGSNEWFPDSKIEVIAA